MSSDSGDLKELDFRVLGVNPEGKMAEKYRERQKQYQIKQREVEANIKELYQEVHESIELLKIQDHAAILSKLSPPLNHPARSDCLEDYFADFTSADIAKLYNSKRLINFNEIWPNNVDVDDFVVNIHRVGELTHRLAKVAQNRGSEEALLTLLVHGLFYRGFSMAVGGLSTQDDVRRQIAKKGGRAKAKNQAELKLDQLNRKALVKYIALHLMVILRPPRGWRDRDHACEKIVDPLLKRMSQAGYPDRIYENNQTITEILSELFAEDEELRNNLGKNPVNPVNNE